MGHIELNLSNIKLCLGAAEVSAAYLGSEQVYPQSQSSDIPNYLSFTNKGTENIGVYFEGVGLQAQPNKVFYYSLDGNDWDSWDERYVSSNYAPIIAPNETLYICGDNNTINTNNSSYLTFKFITSENDLHPAVEAHGNIMSLLSKTGFEQLTSVPDYCFYSLFLNCTTLTTAPTLPATTVGQYAYYDMFNGCTALITAPALPATTLNTYCYANMFTACTSLTTAPTLQATTLAQDCYRGMFYGCTALTAAPALPATTAPQYCYYYMFKGCTSLTTAGAISATSFDTCSCYAMFQDCTSLTATPTFNVSTLTGNNNLPFMFKGCTSLRTINITFSATTATQYCYQEMFKGCTSLTTASELPATTLYYWCYANMFQDCTSLTTAPSILPATTLATYCYMSMFQGCSSLTTSPDLPALTLVNRCYRNMFLGCSSLNYVKAMFTSEPNVDTNGYWLSGVASTGTFVKNAAATWDVTGEHGIPSGWTVTTASA